MSTAACKSHDQTYYENNRASILAKKKEYYIANKDKICQNIKRYREENPEKIANQIRKCNKKHKDKRTATKKVYYDKNREAILEQKKIYRADTKTSRTAYNKQYWAANKDKLCKQNKAYRDPTDSNNIERYIKLKRSTAVSHPKNTDTKVCSEQEWYDHYLKSNGYCARTGLEFDFSNQLLRPSADRIIAGGDYTVDNIQWVVCMYNIMRKDRDADEFDIDWGRAGLSLRY